jgi:hypothetical protein
MDADLRGQLNTPVQVQRSGQRSGAAALTVLVLPVAAAMLLLAVVAALETSGVVLFPEAQPRNVAEAASWGLAAETMRRVAAGERPSAIYHVRPQFISSEVTEVTAIEAAIWSRQVALVALLADAGAIEGEAQRAHLACLAGDASAPDIAAYFAAYFAPHFAATSAAPAATPPATPRDDTQPCEPMAAFERVRMRSR